MHRAFLLEEESAEAALNRLLPRLLRPGCSFRCLPHQGKAELLARLLGCLKNYACLLPTNPDWRVVIRLDADADADCQRRRAALEQLVAAAGLVTKTTAHADQLY